MAKRPGDQHDPRVLRTRRILHETILALADERDLDTLSIADVAERAQMNRATFYAHYRSLDELLDVALQLELEAMISAVTSIPNIFEGVGQEEPPKSVLDAVRKLERRFRVYRRVFGASGSGKVVHGFRQRLAEEIERGLRDGSMKATRELPPVVEAYALAGAVVGVLVHWFSAKPRSSSHRVASWLWQLPAQMAAEATTAKARVGTTMRTMSDVGVQGARG